MVSQHRYLGTVVHFELGSEAAIRARIRAARGALSKAVKALRVKELDARVKGKLLVATIMNVLLYGSETWLIRAEDKLCLNTFWNEACRLAVGTTRAQAISSGFTLKVIRRKLGVEDVDYYLRHRLLNWFGAWLEWTRTNCHSGFCGRSQSVLGRIVLPPHRRIKSQ